MLQNDCVSDCINTFLHYSFITAMSCRHHCSVEVLGFLPLFLALCIPSCWLLKGLATHFCLSKYLKLPHLPAFIPYWNCIFLSEYMIFGHCVFPDKAWQWPARAPAPLWVTTPRSGSPWPKWPWRTSTVTSSPNMRRERWGNKHKIQLCTHAICLFILATNTYLHCISCVSVPVKGRLKYIVFVVVHITIVFVFVSGSCWLEVIFIAFSLMKLLPLYSLTWQHQYIC